MTVKFNYKCNQCEATYLEQRAADESQFFITCQACNAGTYVETSSEVISENIEVVSAPTPEEI